MSLTLGKAEILLEKIAKNQRWKLDNNQCCQKIEQIPEEVCALTTKMDVLLDWLDQRDNYKRDRQAIQDAFDAQNRCGKYLGIEFLDNQKKYKHHQQFSHIKKARMESIERIYPSR
jgi:hypothetical protein